MSYKREQPVGAAVWALVDEIVAERINAGDERLAAVDWRRSGPNMRILDVVTPFDAETEMREQLMAVRPSL
jgi:cytolysin-activating lysine-acyltransferase